MVSTNHSGPTPYPTRKPAKQLDKLLVNLERLLELVRDKPFPEGLHFNLRTVAMTGDPLTRNTEVTRLLRQFLELDGCHLAVDGVGHVVCARVG